MVNATKMCVQSMAKVISTEKKLIITKVLNLTQWKHINTTSIVLHFIVTSITEKFRKQQIM